LPQLYVALSETDRTLLIRVRSRTRSPWAMCGSTRAVLSRGASPLGGCEVKVPEKADRHSDRHDDHSRPDGGVKQERAHRNKATQQR
jgi:hypothetical protein